jgi:hypothetical protein
VGEPTAKALLTAGLSRSGFGRPPSDGPVPRYVECGDSSPPFPRRLVAASSTSSLYDDGDGWPFNRRIKVRAFALVTATSRLGKSGDESPQSIWRAPLSG